jgi:hypothetical protein
LTKTFTDQVVKSEQDHVIFELVAAARSPASNVLPSAH